MKISSLFLYYGITLHQRFDQLWGECRDQFNFPSSNFLNRFEVVNTIELTIPATVNVPPIRAKIIVKKV